MCLAVLAAIDSIGVQIDVIRQPHFCSLVHFAACRFHRSLCNKCSTDVVLAAGKSRIAWPSGDLEYGLQGTVQEYLTRSDDKQWAVGPSELGVTVLWKTLDDSVPLFLK